MKKQGSKDIQSLRCINKNISNSLEQKLNIAMIGHKYIPSREGGIEVVVEELSTRMVALGHQVTVYSRKGRYAGENGSDDLNTNSNKTIYQGVRVIAVPTIEKKGLAAVSSSFFGTLKAIFGKYDCIHYHAEGPSLMLWIPHILGIRTVVTIHGLDWQRAKWSGFATKYIKFGEKIAAKYADEIIVLSKNIQQYFKKIYHRETVFIPNGITKPQNRPAELIKEKWQLDKDQYLLFVGRIVPEKGLQYLIDAFRGVETTKRLVIAGGASDTDDFLAEIKRNAVADDRILFTGFVQGQELEELFSNAYIYIHPSDLEGMSISLLEAMSYGNCCLVSDIPECTEVVDNKAVKFRKSDVKDLNTKLNELCLSPEIVAGYKNIATEYICNKYDWDQVVHSTLDLFQRKGDKLMPKTENIVLVDFNFSIEPSWEFLDAVRCKTSSEWKAIKCISNKDRIGFIGNLKRYIKFFVFPFKIFLERGNYDYIIAWQQFYGLIFALYCRLFNVKKVNKLVVMTFIYKPKKGLQGRLYHRMMKYILDSKYIDSIICFSSWECEYYASLFNIAKGKFGFVYFGNMIEEMQVPEHDSSGDKDYVLSIGFSNRDYNFLIDALKNCDYKVKIYSDKTGNPYFNIEMSNEVLDKKTWEVMSKCKCLVIPLQDTNIAAGQLTILSAMQVGKPVIVTDSKGIRDYIIDGVNGFIIPNESKLWREKIELLYSNDSLYKYMCKSATERYQKYHTVSMMAENIGNIINSLN